MDCSIIILNYQGEKVIQATINSLLKLHYPKGTYEILIIDNNSSDNSRKIIEEIIEKNNNIRSLYLAKNLGFGGGNNEGIKIAKGKYIVLLNNDCVVERNWLRELIKTAEVDSKIFAVSSKILCYPRYFRIGLTINPNLVLKSIHLNKSYLNNYEKKKQIKLNMDIHDEFIEIPFDYFRDHKIEVTLSFYKNNHIHKLTDMICLDSKTTKFCQIRLVQGNRKKIEYTMIFNLDSDKFSYGYDKVQNAGIVVFQDGYGRDIGASVKYQTLDFERDYRQFNRTKEVYAACGAAVLYRKSILKKIGYFDKRFFMYYEDVELSERAILAGYKNIYCPDAIVRHIHGYSSVPGSDFFIYHSEKGRLMHVLFNFPLKVYFYESVLLFFWCFLLFLKMLKVLSDRKRTYEFISSIINKFRGIENVSIPKQREFNKMIQFIKIQIYFFFLFPYLLVIRYLKHKSISNKNIRQNYSKILEGKWYFD